MLNLKSALKKTAKDKLHLGEGAGLIISSFFLITAKWILNLSESPNLAHIRNWIYP